MEQPNGVGGLSNQATPFIGETFTNTHNLRVVKIREKRITDTGLVMYWAEDTDDGRGTYLSDSDLCNSGNWVKTTTFREGKAPTFEDQEKINSNFYRWVCENAPSVAAEFHEVMGE
tara:strand:- start:786 stop:1133 length:348 start_codon:yes stop_codon:yes gene_type:complete